MGQSFEINSGLDGEPLGHSTAIVRIPAEISAVVNGRVVVIEPAAFKFLTSVTANFAAEEGLVLHHADWHVARDAAEVDKHNARLTTCCPVCQKARADAIAKVAEAPVFLGTLHWAGRA